MKLHLKPKITISSVPPQIEVARYNDDLIYYSSPYLYIASISTNKMLRKLRYEDVQMIGVYGDFLYLCISDIYILDLCTYELLDVIRLSKALISNAVFSGNSILVSKVNNRIVYILDRKVVAELSVESPCEGLFLSRTVYGYYDNERIMVFYCDGSKACEREMGDITGAMALDDKVFAMDTHGTLTELISGDSVDLDLEISLCRMYQDFILAMSEGVIYKLDYSGTVTDRQVFAEMVGRYCGSVRDIYGETSCDEYQIKKVKTADGTEISDDEPLGSSGSSSSWHSHDSSQDGNSLSSGSGDVAIAYFGDGFVRTLENDLVFVHEGRIHKIVSFVDDVTDSVEYGDMLILTTSSGAVKYTSLSQYSEGEYVWDSKMVRISLESITCAKIAGDIMITGSKDKTCQVFKLVFEDDCLVFVRIHEFRDFQASIVSLAFEKSVLAVASSDNILQIYRSEQSMPDGIRECMVYFDTFENVSTQHAHSKHITQVAVTSHFIITSSMDRSSKVFDHNGTLVRTLHSDKILNISHDLEHVAISSHKAIRVYQSPSLAQAAVFQIQRPVLSSCFYSGYFLGVTDVLRVYDLTKKKCVRSYDFGLVNCWSFKYPYLCAENKIVILEDRSREVHEAMLSSIRELRENRVLVDKFLEGNNYKDAVEVLLKRDDYRKAHKAIVNGFHFDKGLGFLEEILRSGDLRAKMIECILKNSSLKHSEMFNAVAQRLFHSGFDKTKKERMLQIIRKHADAVDEVFVELLSLDIFGKQT